MLPTRRASAAGRREGGREEGTDKVKAQGCVVQRWEVARVGTESAQYLGPGPSSLSPAFLLLYAQSLVATAPPLTHWCDSSVRCGCFA